MRKKQLLAAVVSLLVITAVTKAVTGADIPTSFLNGVVATGALCALAWIRARLNR